MTGRICLENWDENAFEKKHKRKLCGGGLLLFVVCEEREKEGKICHVLAIGEY